MNNWESTKRSWPLPGRICLAAVNKWNTPYSRVEYIPCTRNKHCEWVDLNGSPICGTVMFFQYIQEIDFNVVKEWMEG